MKVLDIRKSCILRVNGLKSLRYIHNQDPLRGQDTCWINFNAFCHYMRIHVESEGDHRANDLKIVGTSPIA